jgi:hypothetical protein
VTLRLAELLNRHPPVSVAMAWTSPATTERAQWTSQQQRRLVVPHARAHGLPPTDRLNPNPDGLIKGAVDS